MTPEETKELALKQVRKILSEHFASWVVTTKDTDENLNSRVNHDWHGDISDVIGLNRMAQVRFESIPFVKNFTTK